MLFDSNLEPHCAYCIHGNDLGRDEIACIKHGIMHGGGCCFAFKYEPIKRVPPVLPSFFPKDFADEDFAL